MKIPKRFPEMKLSKFILRKPTIRDTDKLFEICKDLEVMKYYGMPSVKTKADIKRELNWFNNIYKKGEGIRWIISPIENNCYIGDLGIFNYSIKHKRAEIGFKLAKDYWRKGIMSEAIIKILTYGYFKMHLNRIEALVDINNEPSMALLVKLKFTKEGILRQYEVEEKGFVDLAIFSILREEYVTNFIKPPNPAQEPT